MESRIPCLSFGDALADPLVAEVEAEAVRWMTTLNKAAAEVLQEVGAHACTDVTGFGLTGHATEMASAGDVLLEFAIDALPEGVTVAGVARRPQDVASSVRDATGAAA